MIQNQHFINGQWLKGNRTETLKVYDKYAQTLLSEINFIDETQLELAIQSAQNAFQDFRKTSVGTRMEFLQKLKEALEAKFEDFVELIVTEAGKPLSYAETEVKRGISTIDATIHELYHFGTDNINIDFGIGENKTALTKRFPVGIVAGITPFNFPLNLVLHKLAPALAVGCAILIKPAPQAPLTAFALGKLCEEIGYPAGLINVFCANIPEAEKMVKDERIAMLSFTGSDKVGWHLKNIVGKKKVSLELGGNAGLIVDETADITQVTKVASIGSFLYAGQICISTQRIFVLESIFEDFKTAFVAETEKLKVGNPHEKDVWVSAVIDKNHLHRIDNWVQEAKAQGAEVLTGGKILDDTHLLYAPTILTNTEKDMKVVAEEAFAPLVCLEKVKSFEEAVQQINDSKYGLQVGVYTNDINRIQQAFEEIEVAGVIINNVAGFRIDNMPYGGMKDSGLGREGLKYAMEEMTELKLLVY